MKEQSQKKSMFDLKKVTSYMLIPVIIMVVMSCSSTSAPDGKVIDSTRSRSDSSINFSTQNFIIDSIVPLLLNASANDFYEHQKPVPSDFRNVQIKYLIKKDVGKLYVLCGEFLSKDNQNTNQWINFATIKNSEYEQWIGSNALAYCTDSQEVLYKKGDLTVALKNKLDSLKHVKL